MPNSALALRTAIAAALAADVPLVAVLGGPKVFDEPPAGTPLPFVTIGDARIEDWSTATERGEAVQLTLDAWSRQGGHAEAHRVAAAVMDALDGAALPLAGHRLVAMALAVADVRREPDGRTYRATIRFRALTERAA